MGKKKKIRDNQTSLPVEKKITSPLITSPWYAFDSFKLQAIVLIIIALVCFANSFKNEYALDDEAIILKNQYVQQGFQGIPQILSSDALASFYKQNGSDQELSGGRYRPLSIVTFAIEQQLLDSTITDDNTQLLVNKDVLPAKGLTYERHVTNVVLYILTVLALLYFLRQFIFKEQPLIPFLTCLLFLIHPVHTEVVANIKSRDEILSFLFFILTFIKAFQYYETQQKKHLYFAVLFYSLALLSKEYAISILILLPMLFYIVKKDALSKSLVRTIPFFIVAFVYVLIRISIVGTGSHVENADLLNDPYLFANSIQKLATKIEILDYYLWLLIHPVVLSSDYSYNAIPYTDFSNLMVWVSLIIILCMIVATIVLFRKRNIISFALAFYLLHLFLVSNFVFDLGATMGERLIYHSSFGFVLIVAIGFNFLLQKINYPVVKKAIIVSGCIVLVYWSAAKDIQRNAEWKNNNTLFLSDVKTVPNSAFTNGGAGASLIDAASAVNDPIRERQMLDSAIGYLKKSILIHNRYVNGYLNLGYAYFLEKNYDSAKISWDRGKKIFPANTFLPAYYTNLAAAYSNKGVEMIKSTQPELGVQLFEKAVACTPNDIDLLNNLGTSYYFIRKDTVKARQQWERSLQIQPGNKGAMDGMALLNKK